MDAQAYLLAFGAILLWSTLASAASILHTHDPIVVTGIGLLIGGILSLPRWRSWRVPIGTWLVGVAGLLGYHLLYFSAFTKAPAIEVNIVNYLWPLFMVVLAPIILGGDLTLKQVLGAGIGLLGTIVLLGGVTVHMSAGHWVGYTLAGASALTWAVYSLMTKRLAPFPTAAVGGFCTVSGLIALLGHWLFHLGTGTMENAVTGFHGRDALMLLGIGVGPLGLAFLCWDAALKRGDPRAIGTLAYLTPLLSTLLLALVTGGRPGGRSVLALILIVGGALLGSRTGDFLGPPSPSIPPAS